MWSTKSAREVKTVNCNIDVLMPTEKQTRRYYSEDIKQYAVALVIDLAYKVYEAAMNSGINDNL
jgi:hypothetical protein